MQNERDTVQTNPKTKRLIEESNHRFAKQEQTYGVSTPSEPLQMYGWKKRRQIGELKDLGKRINNQP